MRIRTNGATQRNRVAARETTASRVCTCFRDRDNQPSRFRARIEHFKMSVRAHGRLYGQIESLLMRIAST